MRKLSIKSLRKKLWKLVSEYVRRKDADKTGRVLCYTCGSEKHWKELNCGHYIHRDCLDFEINNLRPQCVRCNQWLSGNLGIYCEKLTKEIGSEEIELMRQRSNQVKKWNVIELEQLIETYKEAIKALNDRDTVINKTIDFQMLASH